MIDLEGKISLVTGGSRGIGRAIALGLASAGSDIVIVSRQDSAEATSVVEAVQEFGRNGLALSGDLSKGSQVSEIVQKAEAEMGTISVLINSAGINPSKPLADITAEDWEETITTNLSSAFYVTQAVLPRMRVMGWGRIVMISSVAAQLGGVVGPHYAASKAGMIGLAHGYAGLLAKEGITANAIAPALIQTDMLKDNPKANSDLIPVGRFGTVDEVASVAMMLVGNGYITGQTFNVNGGWYMS